MFGVDLAEVLTRVLDMTERNALALERIANALEAGAIEMGWMEAVEEDE